MAQLVKLQLENKKLKDRINQYEQAYGCCPSIDDSLLKGGYRVVKTITDRDAIPCCYRKQGMRVVVIEDTVPYTEYRLLSSNCKENEWQTVTDTLQVYESNVLLENEYLDEEQILQTQKELNQFLYNYITELNLEHNNLEGLQGGQENEYYHLTQEEYEQLQDGFIPLSGTELNKYITGTLNFNLDSFRGFDILNIIGDVDGELESLAGIHSSDGAPLETLSIYNNIGILDLKGKYLNLNSDEGLIRIGSAFYDGYTLPILRGDEGQVLKLNDSGNLEWGDIDLTNFYTKEEIDEFLEDKADDNDVMHLSGDENSTGLKGFENIQIQGGQIYLGSSSFIKDDQLKLIGQEVVDLNTDNGLSIQNGINAGFSRVSHEGIHISSTTESEGVKLTTDSNSGELHEQVIQAKSGTIALIEDIDELEIEFNDKLDELDEAKLDKPTSDGDTTTHPYVVGVNTDGESTRLPAGDLGKNLSNSDLTLNEPRVFETLGNPLSFKTLPDKSADATFTDFLGKNSNGQLAKVGFQAFKATANSWTDAQKNEFSTILNGGYTTGTMSVNLISPPVFEQEDNNVYLVLRGAGLNLHPTDRKIEILRASDNVVLAEIPNGQIQTYASGIELVFYYNYNSLGAGDYKLRITNGVNQYITSLNFKIVSEIENIDLSTITWNKIIDTDLVTNDLSSADAGTAEAVSNIGINTAGNIISLKSSELFSQGEDFYIETQCTTGTGVASKEDFLRMGILYSNQANQLSPLAIHFWGYGKQGSSQRLRPRVNPNAAYDIVNGSTTAQTFMVSITKQGNVITMTDGRQTGNVTISNNNGYSLIVQMKGVQTASGLTFQEIFSMNILKAFKIIS